MEISSIIIIGIGLELALVEHSSSFLIFIFIAGNERLSHYHFEKVILKNLFLRFFTLRFVMIAF